MAKIYWLLNAPGFPLEHRQWVDIGHGIYLGNELVVTTYASVSDEETSLELTVWEKQVPLKSFRIRSGDIVDLSFVGISAELWPVAASINQAGQVLRMLLGLSFNQGEGGNHGLSTEGI